MFHVKHLLRKILKHSKEKRIRCEKRTCEEISTNEFI